MDLSPEKPGKELAGGQLTPSGGTRKVQDFKQESGIFSSSVPEGFTLTIGWYGVKDVMRMGSYGKVLHFSNKGLKVGTVGRREGKYCEGG